VISPPNSTWIGLELNPSLLSERPAVKYGTVQISLIGAAQVPFRLGYMMSNLQNSDFGVIVMKTEK
jgi:hypothetical protein